MLTSDLTFNADGVTQAVPVDRCNEIGIYIEGDGALAAGVVTVETYSKLTGAVNFGAPTGTGGWATTGVTLTPVTSIAGGQFYGRLTGAFTLIRLRITTPITAGRTIIAHITGNAVS